MARVAVCPPFSNSAWDLTGNVKHQRINDAMTEWNALSYAEGGELYFFRTDTDCDWFQHSANRPFVRIVWDNDSECNAPIGILTCDRPYATMGTFTKKYDEWSPAVKQWSNNPEGGCYDLSSSSDTDNCIVWAEIRIDVQAQYDSVYYWGTDILTQYANNQVNAKNWITHELGHTVVLNHLARSDAPDDPLCDDYSFPYTTNSIMCDGLGRQEYIADLALHDKNGFRSHYMDNNPFDYP